MIFVVAEVPPGTYLESVREPFSNVCRTALRSASTFIDADMECSLEINIFPSDNRTVWPEDGVLKITIFCSGEKGENFSPDFYNELESKLLELAIGLRTEVKFHKLNVDMKQGVGSRVITYASAKTEDGKRKSRISRLPNGMQNIGY